MQKPFVKPNISWFMYGNTTLSDRVSPLSDPIAMKVIVKRKMNLAKKVYMSDKWLNIPFLSAAYLPVVSPML